MAALEQFEGQLHSVCDQVIYSLAVQPVSPHYLPVNSTTTTSRYRLVVGESSASELAPTSHQSVQKKNCVCMTHVIGSEISRFELK